MSVPSYHIPMGMMKVVAGPAQLRTVVSVGFALVVSFKDAAVGGLVHLGMRPHLPASRRAMPDEKSVRALYQFLAALADIKPDLSRATFELFGGADILGTFTRGQRQLFRSSVVATFEAIIRRHGGELARAEVGGQHSREVSLRTDSAAVEAVIVGGTKAGFEPSTEAAFEPSRRQTEQDEAARIVKSHVLKSALNRRREERNGHRTVTVNMGCMHVDRSPTQLVALLGSCVGVALVDPLSAIGGLAHVMLPERPPMVDQAAKYADSAVPALLAAVEQAGARRDRLQAMIAGGANTLSTKTDGMLRISRKNIETVKAALRTAEISVQAEDLGGTTARKMWVDLEGFSMRIKLLGEAKAED